MSAGASTAAELSSIGNRIDELAERTGALAAQLDEAHDAEVAASLYEVERSLRMATRNLERARRNL